MRLQGKVALITGAGRGIGRATALTFAREGARVALADIDLAQAESAAAEVAAAGGEALPLHLDVAQAESVRAAVGRAVEWGGRIDVLLNNAGITRDARMLTMTEQQWDAVIDVNLKGVWLCTQAVAPHMLAAGRGSIINASSIVGLYGNFGQTNYAAAKAGVIAMTKTWARELGPGGVRVNAVAPGFIATEMVSTVPAKVVAAVLERTPLRRMGTPEEIAAVYLFLASDESSFVTGAVIQADGGLVI
ncbi:MAG: 3-oxoacyl-ACP reductase FabG [Chloroflexota bacterium]